MASGVKVVGTPGGADQVVVAPPVAVDESVETDDGAEATTGDVEDVETPRGRRRPRGRAPDRGRHRAWVVVLAVIAALGLAGTVGFGVAWAGLHERQAGESRASSAARSFVVDLTNFDAKTVDADFGAITSMSTGRFATQAQKFFNSAIRQDLQKALASSRGQVHALYVQSYGGGRATVYGVVDQLYVNDKISSPQTDVLRMVVTMSQVASRWKVADVTVLQGPSLATGTAASGTGTSGTSGAGTSGSSTSTTAPATASSGG